MYLIPSDQILRAGTSILDLFDTMGLTIIETTVSANHKFCGSSPSNFGFFASFSLAAFVNRSGQALVCKQPYQQALV